MKLEKEALQLINACLQVDFFRESTIPELKEALPEMADSIDIAYINQNKRRARVDKERAHTITTSPQIGTLTDHGVRKLTPRECWRLMGFSDSDFEKAQAVCSNTQLYKQAGNSIVVNVLEAIIKNIDFTEGEER